VERHQTVKLCTFNESTLFYSLTPSPKSNYSSQKKRTLSLFSIVGPTIYVFTLFASKYFNLWLSIYDEMKVLKEVVDLVLSVYLQDLGSRLQIFVSYSLIIVPSSRLIFFLLSNLIFTLDKGAITSFFKNAWHLKDIFR
jgi:hypothetical protein